MTKKIAFFGTKSFPSRGGSDRVAESIIRHLKDHYRFSVYCYRNPDAANHMEGVETVQFREWLPGAPGSFIYFFLSALHLLFRRDIDLVHMHKTDPAFFLPILKLRYPVISTSQEAPYRRDKWNGVAKAYFRMAERMYIRWSDIATCIAEPLTSYYNDRYGSSVRFIPNGINPPDPREYDHGRAAGYLPAGASMDKPFLLFSARRLMSTKGTHTMLEALHRVGYRNQVFIAGEIHEQDPYFQRLSKLAEGLNVHFLGFVHPLNTLLALVEKCELFVFPSENEGMSLMLLEASSVGKPIVASDIPENRQVFREDEVLYFRVSDVDDLAQKITWALDHPEEMSVRAVRCRERVLRDFVMSRISRQFQEGYEQLLAGEKPEKRSVIINSGD